MQFSYTGTTKGQAFDPHYLYERYDITDPYGYNPNTNTFRINLTEDAYEKFKNHPNVESIKRNVDSAGVKEPGVFPNSDMLSWNKGQLWTYFLFQKKGATVQLTLRIASLL
ncbi:MAG: hypothetical protein MH186_07430 [Marinobacter sp.]|nr:hypothetical protein [Marinobacter sp.]